MLNRPYLYLSDSPGHIKRALANLTDDQLPVASPEDIFATTTSQIVDMAYDKTNEKIIWTDSSVHTINRMDVDGSNFEVLASGESSPRGVTVHEASGLIFFVRRGLNDQIFIRHMNLDGSNVTTILDQVTDGLVDPDDIVIDTVNDKIIWTENSTKKIYRANPDGSAKTQIISEPPFGGEVAGLSIDYNNDKLYYTHGSFGGVVVKKANLDGSSKVGVKTISGNGGSNLVVDSFRRNLYVNAISFGAIKKMDLDTLVVKDFFNKEDVLHGMTLAGHDFIRTQSTPLFLKVPTEITSDVPLFISGHDTLQTNTPLFIDGHETLQSNIPLFIGGHLVLQTNTPLFIDGHEPDSGSIPLFIDGHILLTKNTPLFMKSIDFVLSNTPLFIHGDPIPLDTSCPILDPTASIQISPNLVNIFQDNIDALINQLGKNVTLEFTPNRLPCINCINDPISGRSTGVFIIGGPRPFVRGQQCPWCKGRGFLLTPVTECIKGLIKWQPRDAQKYGISVSDFQGIVRFKTFLKFGDDILRAQSAIMDNDIIGQLKMRVRLIRGPYGIGLRESRYIISFWELIGGSAI